MQRLGRLFMLCFISLLVAGCGGAAQQGGSCNGPFEASVRTGPNAGMNLAGDLQLSFDNQGRLSGTLVLNDGSKIGTSGQTVGQAISLLFDVGGEKIFGVGTLESDLQMCTGVSGGPLTGPKAGDGGDWLFSPGSKP